jgi:uncharacterized membrane protein YdjX (TVP38/TMEM64 family)
MSHHPSSPPEPASPAPSGTDPGLRSGESELRLPPRGRRRLTIVARIVSVVLLAGLLWHFWDHQAFLEWKREAGPVPFFLALAILPALGFPTTPFYLIAGATFSLPVALGGSFLALAANLVLCYLVATGPLRRSLLRLLARFDYRLPDLGRRRSWRFLLMVKFMPGVPAFVKNYLLGLAGVPFALYFGVSIAITGIYLTSFVVLGESVLDRDPRQAALALGVLVIFALVIWWYKRRKRA